jgi:exosortase E/protease (VPEID-CTERM system)
MHAEDDSPAPGSGDKTDSRHPYLLAIWAAILGLELLVLRAWLLIRSSTDANGLAKLLSERGPGTLRFVFVQLGVSAVMVSLLFGRSTFELLRPSISRLAQRGVSWKGLLAHGLSVALLGVLSNVVLFGRLSPGVSTVLTGVWLIAGATTLGTLAVAFMPMAFWTLLIRAVRPVLAFALLVGLGAFAFGRAAVGAWQPLSYATMNVVYVMLRPIVPMLSADVSTLTIGNPDFSVYIAGQCSGSEGLGLMLAFLTGWLWFHRDEWRFPQAIILLPIGLAAIWTLNCVRVAGLILVGVAGAPDIAVGGFHSQAGWVAFNAVALGICLTARRVPWLLKQPSGSSPSIVARSSNPAGPYLLPFLAVLAGSMMAQLAASDFEWFYAFRVILASLVLLYFLSAYRTLDWRIEWRAIGIGCLGFAVWIALEFFLGSLSKSEMPSALRPAPAGWTTAWIVVRVVGSVITVPITEELAFRGYLLRWFDSEDFESVSTDSVSWMAVLFSSLAFGMLHGERWLAATVAGVLYAMAYRRRGSIGDAVAAHATTNALIAVAVLVAGRWQFW